jgi:hypothetical protein
MKRFNKKLLLFLLPGMLFLFAIMLYNVVYDPFGVLRGDMENHYTEPNQRYLKAKHLLKNPAKYNAYIFGSSRAGKIDPRNIKTDERWYNQAYSEGLPAEHLEDLRFMVKNDVTISRVVIGMDNVSFLVRPERHRKEVLRKPYKNWRDPFFDYLFLKPDLELRKIQAKRKEDKNQSFYDIYESGMPDVLFRDTWIENLKEKHCQNKKFNYPATTFYHKPRIDKAIKEISDIIKLCKKEDIELVFYIGPMHATTYLNLEITQYTEFITKLAEMTSFYDFSGINRITTDNYFYYETSHFRPLIGDLIMESILTDDFDDFGQFVTENNIEQVVAKKIKDAQAYKETSSKK